MTTGPQGRPPPQTFRTAKPAPVLRIALAAGFAGLLALALAVVFVLPSEVADVTGRPAALPAAPPANPPPPVAAPLPAPAPAASPAPASAPAPTVPVQEADRREADDLLSEALRRLARLESQGARIWGGPLLGTGLADAEATLDAASALHGRQQYADSIPLFREAIARLDRLEASRAPRFRLAMEEGRAALGRADPAAATAAFAIAVAIEPGNDEARAGAERARNMPAVLEALAGGKLLEDAGDLDGALARYRDAAALDPTSPRARDDAARLAAAVAGRDYLRAVSDALARLERNDLRGASAALERARAVHPAAPEVKDIARRLAGATQRATLEGLRRQAAALEAGEDWQGALGLYRKALALDATAAFADSGRARAGRMAALHERLDLYIASPDRLQSPAPLADAKALVAQAGAVTDAGKSLLAKKTYLRSLVAAAETPVPVVLSSDGKTDVQVYRIGTLGSFAVRRLDLRPGTYTVVGSRAGYRDVRLELRVPPGSAGAAATVQCTERIAQ